MPLLASDRTKILLVGSTGAPGRNILESLRHLKKSHSSHDFAITVLKRKTSENKSNDDDTSSGDYDVAYLDESSYLDISKLVSMLIDMKPHIIVSALNAEPRPELDDKLVSAIIAFKELHPTEVRPFFINGYTLDLLHPVVEQLPREALEQIAPKVQFAHRLAQLAAETRLEYCTLVNAAFLDFCLIRGYFPIDIQKRTATLYEGGDKQLTGCSLKFVGDAVAQVILFFVSESSEERALVVNRRVRVAETQYSGKSLVAASEKVAEGSFVINEQAIDDWKISRTISYLNWSGKGASSFLTDGLEFGKSAYLHDKRRKLEDIVWDAALERYPQDKEIKSRLEALRSMRQQE